MQKCTWSPQGVTHPLFPAQPVPRCFECGDLGFRLADGMPHQCWRVRQMPAQRPEPGGTYASSSGRSAVQIGVPIDAQHFEIAKLLTRFSSERPFDKAKTLELHYPMPLRGFMGIVEDLRKVWLLPIGARKQPPSGYWIITDEDAFVNISNGEDGTHHSAKHDLPCRPGKLPVLASQLELDLTPEALTGKTEENENA